MKKAWNKLVDLVRDIIDQSWTLLGMVIAWLVLEGSAKDVTGMLILVTLFVWIMSYPIRNKDDKEGV